MPQYKLMYFNGRGRAERARMLFALKGQEYEDYRFKDGEWATVKGDKETFPLGQAPVLLIDGKAMPHSKAISQYLAREFGLYGANNCEAAKIDVMCETADDLGSKMTTIMFEKDEVKKAEDLAKFKDTVSKPFLTFLNKEIKAAGGRVFVGSTETLADVVVYGMLDYAIGILGDDKAKADYPDLVQFRKGITESSKLSDYIKNRPQTPF